MTDMAGAAEDGHSTAGGGIGPAADTREPSPRHQAWKRSADGPTSSKTVRQQDRPPMTRHARQPLGIQGKPLAIRLSSWIPASGISASASCQAHHPNCFSPRDGQSNVLQLRDSRREYLGTLASVLGPCGSLVRSGKVLGEKEDTM